MLPKSSSTAPTPCGTRQVASYSCTISGPGRGVARGPARSTTGVSTQPASGNQARRLAGTGVGAGGMRVRQTRPLGHAARDAPTDRSVPPARRAARGSRSCVRAPRRTVRRSRGGNVAIGQSHLDLARLPDIAGQRGAAEHVRRSGGKPSRASRSAPAASASSSTDAIRAGSACIEPHAQALARMMLGIRHQQSERAEHARQRRHDDARDAELGGDGGGEQRTIAAECQQRELPSDRVRARPTPRGSRASSMPTPGAACRNAASSTERCSGSASDRAMAARAASASSLNAPPTRPAGSR